MSFTYIRIPAVAVTVVSVMAACNAAPEMRTPPPPPEPETAAEIMDRARTAMVQVQSFRYVGQARSTQRTLEQERHETHRLEGEWAAPDQHFMRQHTVWTSRRSGEEPSSHESTAEWVASGGLVLVSEPGHPWRTLPGNPFDSPSRAPSNRIPDDLMDVWLQPPAAQGYGLFAHHVAATQPLGDSGRLVHYDFYISKSSFRLLHYRLVIEYTERVGPDMSWVEHSNRYSYELFGFNEPVAIEMPTEWEEVVLPTVAPRP